MLRVAALVLVVVLCAWHAPAPDPRVLAMLNANAAAANVQAGAAFLAQYPDGEFVCPMDKDVRASKPGSCPRCGMKLVEGIKDAIEYPVHMTATPQPRVGTETLLNFDIVDPRTQKPVRDFDVVHEKLYHIFVVSQDLKFFVHTHPERRTDEDFHLSVKFPKAGMYRVLSDFYPRGGTPQLITNTVMVPGAGFQVEPAKIAADVGPQVGENGGVELVMSTPHPIAGEKLQMLFKVTPDDGIEPYLGSMAHMLAASSDLIDMMHNHPFAASDEKRNSYKQLQFNMIFRREGFYRVWIQFQRKGVVNTVAFNIPVERAF